MNNTIPTSFACGDRIGSTIDHVPIAGRTVVKEHSVTNIGQVTIGSKHGDVVRLRMTTLLQVPVWAGITRAQKEWQNHPGILIRCKRGVVPIGR